MRMFQADEIVAAVACWPKHHPVARLAQRFNGLYQQTGWKGWAVAIDEQDTVMSGKQERARRARQHVSEIIASLQQQSESCRKQLPHDVFGARRSIDAIAANAEHPRYRLDCRGDVAQKAGGQLRCGNGADGRRKPRL